MEALAIQARNIEFTYQSRSNPTLRIDRLDVAIAERVFVHGPSGSGKTTLLESLAGVLAPQKGSLTIFGHDLVALTSKQRDQFRAENLGYIFQSFNLIPYLSVEENIRLPVQLSTQKKLNEMQVNKRFLYLCDTLGISALLNEKVTELSVGQQQRVAVARALLPMPKMILADEPTSALDYDHREKFIRLLFELCKENQITLVFVSHDKTLMPLFDRHIPLSEINRASAR